MAGDGAGAWGPNIDVHTLASLQDEGAVHTVLDVREPTEVAVCSIADSMFIPMQQVPGRIDGLPRDHPLIILCHHGTRSEMVAGFLRNNGFTNIYNLAGGIDAWAQVVETDMARY